MAAFRILSLDGGGMMGAFSASVLATYELECKRRTGRGLADHFKRDDAQAARKLIEIGRGVAAQVSLAEMVKRDFLNGQPAEPLVPE